MTLTSLFRYMQADAVYLVDAIANGEAPGARRRTAYQDVEWEGEQVGVMHGFGGVLKQAVAWAWLCEDHGKNGVTWEMVRRVCRTIERGRASVKFRPFQAALRKGAKGEAPEQFLSMLYSRQVERDGSWCLAVIEGGLLALLRVAVFVVVETGEEGAHEREMMAVGELYPSLTDTDVGIESDGSGATVLRFHKDCKETSVPLKNLTESVVVLPPREDSEGDHLRAMPIASSGSKWKALHVAASRELGLNLR